VRHVGYCFFYYGTEKGGKLKTSRLTAEPTMDELWFGSNPQDHRGLCF
jgi:hypothetical protein